jgi:hypothetical protein
MPIESRKKAAATPAIRERIGASPKGVKTLARESNLSRATARKRRGREDAQDASRRPHRMRTTLGPAQEALAAELRRAAPLSPDDLAAIARARIRPQASRAAVGRLLKREGVSRLTDPMPQAEGEPAPKKPFQDYAPGHLRVDLEEPPRMPDEAGKACLCVAIDRASRRVHLEILPDKGA